MSSMSFNIRNYGNNLSNLMFAVSRVIEQLMTNDYVVEFYYDDCGIYVLNYDYRDSELASRHLFWLDTDEAEGIIAKRCNNWEEDN